MAKCSTKMLPSQRFEVMFQNQPLLAFSFRKSQNKEAKGLFQVWFSPQLNVFLGVLHVLFVGELFLKA